MQGVLASWRHTKRNFTEEEILNGEWVMVGNHNYSSVVKFSSGGVLHEQPLFDTRSWGEPMVA